MEKFLAYYENLFCNIETARLNDTLNQIWVLLFCSFYVRRVGSSLNHYKFKFILFIEMLLKNIFWEKGMQ